MVINGTLIALIISFLCLVVLIWKLNNEKNRNSMHNQFILFNSMVCIHLVGLILQILFSKTNVQPIYFEYITYIGAMFMPVVITMIAIKYIDKDANLKKYRFLYIVPLLLLIGLWTNDFHHLFYVKYDVAFKNTQYGPLLYVYAVFSYLNLFVSMLAMIIHSIKKTGIFSRQMFLLILAILVPVVGNMVGFLNILPTNVYTMPILFSAMSILLYLAIIKFKALNVIPVAFKTIIDTMSDSFVVVSEDGTIADLNSTFIKKFKPIKEISDRENLFEILKDSTVIDLKQVKLDIAEAKDKGSTITKEYHIAKEGFDKYFEVDFQPIKSKDNKEFIATLLLLRDVTTAKKDMEIMMKNEGLVLLGELAGGVAHDINTPISAIKSGLLMLKDTVKTDDEKMLVERMDSCATKIVTLVNSLRNQIRNLGSDEILDVNVTTVVKDIQVITHNELMKNRVEVNIDIKKEIIVKGNPTKLSQVVTNLVVNSAQAYEGKGGKIEIVVDDRDTDAVISVEDWAGGIPESIRPYIFKNILTTKGVSGTGFGLYLAYSVIKGAFSGDIYFETETGKGTKFFIVIPKDKQGT